MTSIIPKPLFYLYNSNIQHNISRYLLQTENNQVQLRAKFSRTPCNYDYCPCRERGLDYMRDSHLNKGLAFTLKERQALGIHGLIAPTYKTQEEQVEICKLSFDRHNDPLDQYLYLSELHDENQRLFFSLINTDIEKFLPVIYTPTVGLACLKYGFVYRKAGSGLFLSIKDKGRVYNMVRNWPADDVRVVCVTDGERILGLGDLGAFGMGIPIGKLALYTALAGVKPYQCLPITLDVGTNNKKLHTDPLYIGLRQDRAKGEEYLEFIDEFMEACIKRFGKNTLIQFEDFAQNNALALLSRYQDSYCTFNDDIQGTAAAILAGIFGAIKIQKKKISDNIFLFFGAGSAAIGIANLLVDAMVEEGLSLEDGRKKIFLFDIDGIVTTKREQGVPSHTKDFAKDAPPSKDFAKAVVDFKPTCLVGASTVGNAFTADILKQMAKNAERPIIFALSNPTIKAECTPQQAYDNTEGRCIYASGSPFPPVKFNNKIYHPGQGNNAYIFPGMGLGIIAADITTVTNKMFLTSAKSVGKLLLEEDMELGRIYPSLKRIREISYEIAKDIVNLAFKEDIAALHPQPDNIEELIKSNVYNLTYPDYSPVFYDHGPDANRIHKKKNR